MNIRPFIRYPAVLLILVSLGFLVVPDIAFCRLSGEAELGYVNYDSHDNLHSEKDTTFTQRYSALYEGAGKLVNGRLGRYDVKLGYEWLSFDTNIKSDSAPQESISASKGHLLYSGELVLDPKEIPFRLTLHSRDLNKIFFDPTGSTDSIIFNPQQSAVADPGSADILNGGRSRYTSLKSTATTSISGGKRIDSGAMLVMGVKNGMTNGYNEVLRHFPLLMLDYTDSINVDRSGVNQVDNRLSRLAFVSLNKKDNWFHYRYVTYVDNLNSVNNYVESQIQLGTVDHVMQRRWIDFTNWLKVSADGQFTKRERKSSEDNYEDFTFNLFGIARRQTWEMRSFNSFNRYYEVDSDRLTYSSSVPLYANGIISPTANWNAYAKYNDTRADDGRYLRTMSGSYSMDAYRHSDFTLNQGISAEKINTTGGNEYLVTTGKISTASTAQYSRDLALSLSYVIKNSFNNDTNSSDSYTEQQLDGLARYKLSDNMLIVFGQSNRLAKGASPQTATSLHGLDSSTLINDVNQEKGTSYQSRSSVNLEWTPKPRLRLRLTAEDRFEIRPDKTRYNAVKATVSANYQSGQYAFSSQNVYDSGNSEDKSFSRTLSSIHSLSYIYSRNLDTKVSVSYYRAFDSNNSVDTFNFEQSLNYNFYKVNGIVRKLFEINETFSTSEEVLGFDAFEKTGIIDKQRTNSLLLGAKYYPLRQVTVAGGARYTFISGNNRSLNYYASISAQYRLLDMSLDYTSGINKADGRVENRLSANIRKKF